MPKGYELLKADRSWCNESKGKEMFGCLAVDGVVECYFPTQSSFERNGKLFLDALVEQNWREKRALTKRKKS